MTIALDATYSLDDDLSGVGIYSKEILAGLASAHPGEAFRYYYRPHRFLRSFSQTLPPNAGRRLLHDSWRPRGDVFHALNQRLPRTRPRRAVATFHDLFVLTGDYSTPEFRRRFAAQARDAAAGCERIITVSAFTAGQVEQLLGVERSRIRVVHHGIRPLPAGAEPREKIVLHVGAIQRRKNVARLVAAFEALDDGWRLVLAGSAGYGAAEIFDAIRRSRARERILVAGYIPAADLGAWYRRASIFAFPSLDEGFGMPVLEAMAAGVPVLTSNRSALPEVAGGAALLVDPGDTGAIASELVRLALDDGLREDLRTRGLRRCAEFTWEKAVKETWDVYRELRT